MRGQYFSFDAIVAAIIFILALVTLLSTWHSLRTSLEYQSSPLSFEALRISEELLTPGSAIDGSGIAITCNEMQTLGLAISWQDRRIDDRKLESCASFSQNNPQKFKEKLSTSYNVSILREGKYAMGDDIIDSRKINTNNLREISKVRKVVSIYNSTKGVTVLSNFDVYVFR